MTSHKHSGENTDIVKFLSCEICDKTFNRQATLIRHTQTVHGPMINCVHPQCNYAAPQSRTNQLQQHMARVHDLHYYKSGSIGVSREEEMSDPRMVGTNVSYKMSQPYGSGWGLQTKKKLL